MGDSYETNGDYKNYEGAGSSDFKRKSKTEDERIEEEEDTNNAPGESKINDYVKELLGEKLNIDHKLGHTLRLIDQEVNRAQTEGKLPHRENKYVDIYREKPIKVSVKVLVPVREHPKFNFVGKLLGPKGNSMKRLQEDTMCKMAVLGRGSMKDRQKEEELRNSLDPKYAHLADDLHVEISALGPPAEAHARVAYALAEVRKYLVPDNNDTIRQEQMREMMTEPNAPPEEMRGAPTFRRGGMAGGASRGGGLLSSRGSLRPSGGMLSGVSNVVSGPRSPVPTPRVMPAKTKILSILDRARVAMEESYGYEEPPFESSYGGGDSYSYSAPPPPSSRVRYSAPAHPADYEPAEYGEYAYRRGMDYEDTGSSRWKSYSSSKGRVEEPSLTSRHVSTRDTRYRSSPYSRPTK
ncbi:KH domain-containing, RNA-binding, signal transduction-associated protein 3-like isoform X3 [Ctenocephalides felis]|uniref:KH domain-containing, RNA-binding, signal transduction-associated protein 3-like isoform X3 n=1 Tax=Ctenocephalides felis TaxID=7515 RepID=UPI000E6E4003|nr:KH domain-containing, RNA-binding, signal transduction-associated protein 3-like isoform X3 [Ctenocephalides felis]